MTLADLINLDHKLWRERVADKQEMLKHLQAMNEALLERLANQTVQPGDPNYTDSGQMASYGHDLER
jgi:hypothetical protein